MRIGFAALVAVLMLAGCAKEPQIIDRQSYLAEASRKYPAETRERVIAAAETVLRISDPKDFEFRDRINGFIGLRKWFIYAVIASASGVDKWDFTAEEVPEGVQASVSISVEGASSSGYSSQHFEGAQNTIVLYQLFWRRVEYVLGRAPSWVTCKDAWEEQDNANKNRGALEALCGITSDGREAPAPPQMAPIKIVVPVVTPKKPERGTLKRKLDPTPQ